jgi:hypothetical protein
MGVSGQCSPVATNRRGMGDDFARRLALAFISVALVSGCGSQGSSPAIPAMRQQAQQSPAAVSGRLIYVTDTTANDSGSVLGFRADAHGNVRPAVRLLGLRTGLGPDSRSVATDSLGRLYVIGGDRNSGKIYIWPPGSNGNVRATAFFTACRNAAPYFMVLAVDPSDHLWVACRDEGRAMLLEYPQIRADATGDISSDYPPLRDIEGEKTGLRWIRTIAFNPKGQVTVNTGRRMISTFAQDQNGNGAPVASLGGHKSLVDGIGSIGYDTQGRLVACTYKSARPPLILTFARGASGNVEPINIRYGIGFCLNFAFDPRGGNMYTVTPSAITEYAATPPRWARPIRVIHGNLTHLTDASSIAFGGTL